MGRGIGAPEIVVADEAIGAGFFVTVFHRVLNLEKVMMGLVVKVIAVEYVGSGEQVIEGIRGHGSVHLFNVVRAVGFLQLVGNEGMSALFPGSCSARDNCQQYTQRHQYTDRLFHGLSSFA